MCSSLVKFLLLCIDIINDYKSIRCKCLIEKLIQSYLYLVLIDISIDKRKNSDTLKKTYENRKINIYKYFVMDFHSYI